MTHTHEGACSCGDYSMTRRAMLARAGAVGAGLTVTQLFGDVLTQTVYGVGPTQNVLVVLSLRGGADGMSMVVPHAEANYYASRPSIAVNRDSLLFRDPTFGLHPNFSPLTGMWNAGKLAAIHAVGLPAPNRSHFDAQEELEEATPGSSKRVGWLNRMIGGLAGDSLIEGVQVGGVTLPTSLVGPADNALAVNSFADAAIPWATDTTMGPRSRTALNTLYGGAATAVGVAGQKALQLSDAAASIATIEKAGAQNGANYPGGGLSDALKRTAALVRGSTGVRAVAVDYGGWDHHTDLTWRMNGMVTTLASNLAAFFTDLGNDGSRVTVVTLSEFGRRLGQNGANGLDHGYGNCVFVAGGGVKGGTFYANWPGLDSNKLNEGDLALGTDYRDVLADVLRSRFPSLDLSAVFPGTYRTSGLGFMV